MLAALVDIDHACVCRFISAQGMKMKILYVLSSATPIPLLVAGSAPLGLVSKGI